MDDTQRAQPGDELVIRGHTIHERPVTAEILEVIGEQGHERYLVRWDDGHESIHYPGSDAFVRHLVRSHRRSK